MELLKIFERYPFSRLCIALILGIWISDCSPGFSYLALLVAFFLFLIITISTFYSVRWQFRWINGGCWILLFVAIGYLILPPLCTLPPSIADSKSEVLLTITRQTTTNKSGAIQLVGTIEKALSNDSILRNKKILLTLINPSQNLNLTNRLIAVNTSILPIYPSNNPGQFDYNSYLLTKGIYGRALVNKYKIVDSNLYSVSLSQKIASCANFWLKNTYKNLGFKDNELGVMLALIDGDRSAISGDVKLNYQQTGTTHILAVSGLHVGVIMELLIFLFGWLDRYRMRITKVVIILFLIWIYAIISGLEASILRATIMFSILLVARQLGRNVKLENSLFLSAFLIILIAPSSLFEAGFWLSYLAVASIIIFSPRFETLFQFNNYMGKKIWQLVAVTLSAQVATLPYILFLFGTFPTYFLISNLLILPIVPVAMFGGIAIASLSLLTTHFVLANKLVILTIAYMNGVVDFLQKLPMAQISGLNISFSTMMLIYLIIILLLLYFENRKAVYLFCSQFIVIALLGSIAVNLYKNNRSFEFVVFTSKDLLLISKNGNRYSVITPKLNKQNGVIAEKYIARYGCENVKIDTVFCSKKLTPFFNGESFGVIAENINVLKVFHQLKYKPRYLVVDELNRLNYCGNDLFENNLNLVVIANKFENGTNFKSTLHCWSLEIDGAFVD